MNGYDNVDDSQLESLWRAHKEEEALSRAQRISVEEEIERRLKVRGEYQPKGTMHFGELNFVTGFKTEWDNDGLMRYFTQNPSLPNPFKTQLKVTQKGLDLLAKEAPAVRKDIQEFETTKEKKPYITIRRKK